MEPIFHDFWYNQIQFLLFSNIFIIAIIKHEIKYLNTLNSLNNTCWVCKSFSFNGGVVEDCIIQGCDAASFLRKIFLGTLDTKFLQNTAISLTSDMASYPITSLHLFRTLRLPIPILCTRHCN